MTTPKLISDLIVSPETWCKGEYARDEYGCALNSWRAVDNCSYCLSGAIRRIILDEMSEELPDTPRYRLTLSEVFKQKWREKLNILAEIIKNLFPNRLPLERTNKIVAAFNDHHETTFEDIQAVLAKAKEYGL